MVSRLAVSSVPNLTYSSHIILWKCPVQKDRKEQMHGDKIVQESRDGSTEKHANKGMDDSSTKVIATFFSLSLKFHIRVKQK